MKWIKYSKYTGEDFGIDAQDLLQALSDFLLQSGFNDPYNPSGQWQEQSLEDLKRAIERALEDGNLFPDEKRQEMLEKLQSLSAEQMEMEYPEVVLGAATSTQEFLIHLYGHLNWHLGQVDYLRRILVKDGIPMR